MKRWKLCAHFLIAALLSFFLWANATSQDQKAVQPTPSELQATKPPEHPITEEQLRTFFKLIHFLSVNRPLIHEKVELQRKQLPEWYPQSVWDEIADAIDNIDYPKVALPVYQKYVSEDDASFFNRFMATPQGQKLARSLYAKETQAVQGGAAPLEAYEQALGKLARDEGAEVERILSGMSPKELLEIESQSARWQRMQPVMRQMRGELSQAIVAKQTDLARAVATKHQSELIEAKRNYEASQPPAPSSQSPQ
jgi:hypothetical protein